MSDVGGEPPCWAHLADELDTGDPAASAFPGAIDLNAVAGSGPGAVWSLPHGGDLDANLVVLPPGGEIGSHRNAEVDVLTVVWAGSGRLTIDDEAVALAPGMTVLVPRGAQRAVAAGADGVRYLSVHRRRDGLNIGRR